MPKLAALSVVCYPQQWDSVSFYLPQADIRAYSVGQRAQLLDDLRRIPARSCWRNRGRCWTI